MLLVLSNGTWPAMVRQVAAAVVPAKWDRILSHRIFSIAGLAHDSPALILSLRGLSLMCCPV